MSNLASDPCPESKYGQHEWQPYRWNEDLAVCIGCGVLDRLSPDASSEETK